MFKNLRQIIIGSAVIALMLFLSASSVAAAPVTIISTTDTPVQGQNATLGAFGNTALAQSFVTDSTGGEVTSIVIQDAYVNPFTTNHNVKIYSAGAEGVIGSPLISFDANATGSNGLLTFAPTTEVTLDPSTMYWVVVKSTDSITWKYSNTVNSGTGTIPETMYRARSTDNGVLWSYDSDVDAGGAFGTGAWNFNMRVLVNPPLSIEPITVSDIGRSTATLQGRFQNPSWDTNNPDITASIGFFIGTSAGFAVENYVAADEISSTSADVDGYYSIPFSTLTCGTDYYVRSFINVYDENPGGENQLFLFRENSTNEISFTTDGCFTVAMDDISGISQTSATLQALVQNPVWNNVDSSAELRFYVDTAEDFGSENSFTFLADSMDEDGYYSAAIPVENALTCGTTYYVYTEVYAYDQWETWSEAIASEDSSFTTADCASPAPTVSYSLSSGYNPGLAWKSTTISASEDKKTCPANQILTQNLKSGARNGKYNTYTKAIVTEAHVLQAHLNRLGFSSGKEDGILGRISDGAIKRMQTFLGTKADGFVGPITRGLINNSCGANGLQKN